MRISDFRIHSGSFAEYALRAQSSHPGANHPGQDRYQGHLAEHIHLQACRTHCILSKERLSSSIRNAFPGKVQRILNHGVYYEVWVTVNGTILKRLITKGALIDLGLSENASIWASFKSTAIHTF